MDANFIITRDEKVKDILLSQGLELLQQTKGTYTFMNSSKFVFSGDLKDKLVFTNKLFI